jgi:hypothetical protein
VSPFIEFQEPLIVEDSHFVSCIRDGVSPLTGGSSGIAVVAVLEAAQNAMLSGQPMAVEIPKRSALTA